MDMMMTLVVNQTLLRQNEEVARKLKDTKY
jgi:hypothetical protein